MQNEKEEKVVIAKEPSILQVIFEIILFIIISYFIFHAFMNNDKGKVMPESNFSYTEIIDTSEDVSSCGGF